MPDSSVVALELGILLRLAGMDLAQCDAPDLCPLDHF